MGVKLPLSLGVLRVEVMPVRNGRNLLFSLEISSLSNAEDAR